MTAFQAEGCGIALTGDEYYNAAFRRSRPHRVSYSFLPSYIPSPLRGPLPLKGTQERYRICLSASYVMKSITVISHLRWLPPFGALRHHLPAPLGSVSHDSQVALLPYESCSLATAVSVGRQKESAFMGRLGALLRPTCTSYAGCAQWTIKLRKAIPSLNA